ncbi:MAG: hypothetical protein KAJ24_00670, partial [Candidatus Aenigmarchaeota archaeon]|nr:hypothetical protein [Candidatus Aenigmarchaeota archaeon]
MEKKTTLVLFTSSYPYGMTEYTFLNPETEYLVSKFDQIIIVPTNPIGAKKKLSNKICVEKSYAKLCKHDSLIAKIFLILCAFFSISFYRQFASKPTIVFHPKKLSRLIAFVGEAENTKKWIDAFMRIKGLDPKNTILYT